MRAVRPRLALCCRVRGCSDCRFFLLLVWYDHQAERQFVHLQLLPEQLDHLQSVPGRLRLGVVLQLDHLQR